MTDNQEFRDQVARIEGLIGSLESAADPALRAAARNLVQAIMDLHSGAIDRILEIVSKAGEPGAALLRSLAADELVSSVLVLYDLHPDDFETRVHRGIEKARQAVVRRGAELHLLALEPGSVRVKIETAGHSCGSTVSDLEKLVRDTLLASAPDAVEIAVETPRDKPVSGFVPLASLEASNSSSRSAAVLP
jgi:Fe-S cluster biogenesis protein NfuA